MKKQKLYLILLLFLGTGLSLRVYANGDIVPASGILEREGNEVFLSYSLTVKHEAVSTCRTAYITPRISGKGETRSFPPVIINGRSRNRVYERWVALNGKNSLPEPYALLTVDSRRDQEVDFSTVMAYEPWMEEAELWLEERVFLCGAEESRSHHQLGSLKDKQVSDPVSPSPSYASSPPVTSSRTKETVATEQMPASAERMDVPSDYNEKEGVAYIIFEQGKSIIRPMYYDNRDELKAIAEVIRSIEKDERAKISAVILTGYASPEGSEIMNYRLSKQRTDAVINFINEEFNLRLTQKQIKTSSRGEDWEGLRTLLEEEYIPYRREVMKIIDADLNLDEKEHRLKSIANGEVFRILEEDYFPQLRKTKYQIFYKTNG